MQVADICLCALCGSMKWGVGEDGAGGGGEVVLLNAVGDAGGATIRLQYTVKWSIYKLTSVVPTPLIRHKSIRAHCV
jgi:hypothetical protein